MRKIILLSKRKSAISNPNTYVFDASTGSFFNTDFDLDTLDNQTIVIKGKITTLSGEKTMLGITNTAARYFYDYVDSGRFNGLFREGTDSEFISSVDGWTKDSDTHTFAQVYDGANIHYYIDGVLIESGGGAGFTGFSNTRLVQIGAKNSDLTKAFIGEMTDYQHYNVALTAQNLLDLQADITDTKVGLVANFASQKSTNWTDEVSGFVATNQGGVALI